MANTLHLERLRFYNEDGGGMFDKIWDPMLNFFFRVGTNVICAVYLQRHSVYTSFILHYVYLYLILVLS